MNLLIRCILVWLKKAMSSWRCQVILMDIFSKFGKSGSRRLKSCRDQSRWRNFHRPKKAKKLIKISLIPNKSKKPEPMMMPMMKKTKTWRGLRRARKPWKPSSTSKRVRKSRHRRILILLRKPTWKLTETGWVSQTKSLKKIWIRSIKARTRMEKSISRNRKTSI